MKRIFVVGCPRSGTTLVQSLLAGHSRIRSYTESHFYDKGFSRKLSGGYRVSPSLQAQLSHWAEENGINARLTDVTAPADNVEVSGKFISLLDSVTASRGGSAWIEKTPDHIFRIGLIRAAAPDSLFVHVVRRGPDVVASLRKATKEWGHQRSWTRCAAHWAAALRQTWRYAGMPNHSIVVYEDLVRSSEAALRSLLHNVELEWEPDLLERRVHAAGPVISAHETWKSNNVRPIQAGTERPASEIPAPARWIIQAEPWYRLIVQSTAPGLGRTSAPHTLS